MDSDQPGRLSLEEVLRLQRELYAAYADDGFQQKLEEVEAQHGKAYQKYTSEHTQLFLSVQDSILPKYGFDQGQKGVVQMLDAASRFNGNEAFQQNRLELNRLIGLAPAAEEEPDVQRRRLGDMQPSGCPGAAASAQAADPAELLPPVITEVLHWQPGERRSLKTEGGGSKRSDGALPRPWSAEHEGPGQELTSVDRAARSSGGEAAPRPKGGKGPAEAAGEDIGSWVRSLSDGSLAAYEPFLRRLVSNTADIKRSYPLLQDFFAAVPVNDPQHRQMFARAIRALPDRP